MPDFLICPASLHYFWIHKEKEVVIKGETMLGMCCPVNLVIKVCAPLPALSWINCALLPTSSRIKCTKFSGLSCVSQEPIFLKPVQNIPKNMVQKHIFDHIKKKRIKKRNLECLHISEPLNHQQTQYSRTLANSNYKPNRTYNTNITDIL